MAQIQRVCKPQGISTWVDLGVDVHGFTLRVAAQRAVAIFEELSAGLEAGACEH